MINAEMEYSNRIEKYDELSKELSMAVSRAGSLRLITFLLGVGITIYTYVMKSYAACGVLFIISSCIFIYLVIAHRRVLEKKTHAETLRDINVKALKRVKGEWKKFEDDGSEFLEENHSYSGDLDIFGKGSLFQWINTASTYTGRSNMKKRLSMPLKAAEDIVKTQSAVKELAGELDFRQEYNAEGMAAGVENPEDLIRWGEEVEEFYLRPEVSILTSLLPFITVSVIILSFITSIISKELRYILVILQMLLLVPGKGKRSSSLSTIYKFKDDIKVYKGMLKLLIEKDFESILLKEYKEKLKTTEALDAAKSIDKLSRICDMVSERKNMYFIIVDILLLWDYRCMIELEKWKLRYGRQFSEWFNVTGEFEALSSISNIAFEHADWTEPVFEQGAIVEAEKLGHPLIEKNRVCNNVSIKNSSNILLITGSNMSGKSTFLRTIGINLILAYIGAPVCAEKFSCSIFNIYTCMRVSDNLEKNISSFYAEILRIKMIVEACKSGERIFFLLDEIFKGTNSSDRHAGAEILIKQLGSFGASGIVSTHDLELGEMEKEYGRIKNYHFQEYYENNELKFDYRLRPGVSSTRNAMYLIKLAGIDGENL